MHSINVNHTAQIAHRLSLLPGKCQNIHGHSLSIDLAIYGDLDENGILAGLDFGTVKSYFRKHIDENWDHKLHLNASDPWARQLRPLPAEVIPDDYEGLNIDITYSRLPGLATHPGDPTTENVAMWIAEWANSIFGSQKLVDSIFVNIQETSTNGASCGIEYEDATE